MRKLPPAVRCLQIRVARLEAEFALWQKAAGALALALGQLYPHLFEADAPATPATRRPATIHAFRSREEEGGHE